MTTSPSEGARETCDDFLAELARAIERGDARTLATRAHVALCSACRARLDEEVALDALLGSAPDARPPADLPRRLLSELPYRSAGLDAGGAEARLDELLGRVPEPVPPADLSRRVLSALAGEREVEQESGRGRHGARRRTLLALAAALLFLVAGVFLARRLRSTPRAPELAQTGNEPEAELLEALDALENWDVVTSDDLDLLLAELDPLDTTLLELGDETAGDETGG